MKKRPATIQEWQERTGTTTGQLAEMTMIRRDHLSKILSRSRRCSYEKALRLAMVTGVPVENLIKWMTRDDESQPKPAA